MKRTQELTSIHYRRSVKRSASRVLHGHCPVCGSPLEAVAAGANGPENTQEGDRESAERIVIHLVRKEPGPQPEKDSGDQCCVRVSPATGSHIAPLALADFADSIRRSKCFTEKWIGHLV